MGSNSSTYREVYQEPAHPVHEPGHGCITKCLLPTPNITRSNWHVLHRVVVQHHTYDYPIMLKLSVSIVSMNTFCCCCCCCFVCCACQWIHFVVVLLLLFCACQSNQWIYVVAVVLCVVRVNRINEYMLLLLLLLLLFWVLCVFLLCVFVCGTWLGPQQGFDSIAR